MRKSLLSIFLVFSNPSFAFKYRVSSADNCIKLCDFVSNCENWTFTNYGWCYLKNSDCSVRLARGFSSGPKKKNFQRTLIATNVDCYGGDLKDGGHCRLRVKTPNECQTICRFVKKCEMWEYNIHSNNCHLKKSKNFRTVKDYTSDSIAGYQTGGFRYYTYLSSGSDEDNLCHTS